MAGNTSVFPSKDQAIVFLATDDLILSDYVMAIGNIVTPKNIIFASRLSKFPKSNFKLLVDEVVAKHETVTIKDKDVKLRRLLNPSRRIILSNVCPSIPHHIFENSIKALGYTMVSSMSFIKAGIDSDEYAHVLSFRRQIYVQPNDAIDIPSSLVFKYEDTNYRIFLNFDDVCYKCRLAGHFVNDCFCSFSGTIKLWYK
ncbi:hypothetical protein BDFB_007686 [Asbolus verrucosus]|uniref:CCHC-type domain-containing protein n=1 Tax=Asbolus verrucosus TaxID=1661398 RepID=A0A482VFS4_ASBVE|nr:hypothetical protein BDFB_007686 [Asbolus verrucosus]